MKFQTLYQLFRSYENRRLLAIWKAIGCQLGYVIYLSPDKKSWHLEPDDEA